MRKRKVSVIGSGFTGATTALMLAQKNLVSEVLLVDIPNEEKKTKGKALDMMQTGPIYGFDTRITGTSNYADTAGSDIVIITAGMPRKPGMSRDDLVTINANIMKTITKEVVKYSPECIILVLTNPVDAMTYTVYKESGFPKNRVLGQSGILDTARFCTFVAEELNLSVKDVTGVILGGHGDDMVPLIRYSYAGGIPIETLMPKDRLDAIVQRTRLGGGEIVSLLGDGSAYYAPAASLVEMTEAILHGKRRIMPAVTYLEGEYGYNDIYLGVPTIIGRDGVEGVIELELTNEEKSALNQSVESLRGIIKIIK